MKEDDKKAIFKTIEQDIEKIEDNNKYPKLIKYFKRNWLNFNFINFDSIGDEKIKNRTNNKIEVFHRTLNQTIEISHPKISFFVEKLKMIITNKYREYIVFENKISNKEVTKYKTYLTFYIIKYKLLI